MKTARCGKGRGRTRLGVALALLGAAGCSREEGPAAPPPPAAHPRAVAPAPPAEDASAEVLAAVKDLLAAPGSGSEELAVRVEDWKLPDSARWIEVSFEEELARAILRDYESVMAKFPEAMRKQVEHLAQVKDLAVTVQRHYKGSETGAPPRLRRCLRATRDVIPFYVVRFKRGNAPVGSGVWVVVMSGGKPRMLFHEVER